MTMVPSADPIPGKEQQTDGACERDALEESDDVRHQAFSSSALWVYPAWLEVLERTVWTDCSNAPKANIKTIKVFDYCN